MAKNKIPRKIPAWASKDHNRWPAGCTPRPRRLDSLVQKAGRTRLQQDNTAWARSKTVGSEEAIDRRHAQQQSRPQTRAIAPIGIAIGASITAKYQRPAASRDRWQNAALDNYVNDLNAFGKFVGGDTLIKDITAKKFTDYIRKSEHGKHPAMTPSSPESMAFFNSAMRTWKSRQASTWRAHAAPEQASIRDDRISRTAAIHARRSCQADQRRRRDQCAA